MDAGLSVVTQKWADSAMISLKSTSPAKVPVPGTACGVNARHAQRVGAATDTHVTESGTGGSASHVSE